jgi:hypothetical protein
MAKKNRQLDGGLELASREERPTGSAVERDPDAARELSGGAPATEGQSEEIAGFPAVSPFRLGDGDAGDTSGGDEPRRRRGRKPGWRKSTPAQKVSADLSSLANIERMLASSCMFLGHLASCPELELEDDEAKEIADAVRELAKHYPIGISEKAMAWVNFSFATGGVFGPKVIAIYKRSRPAAGRPAEVHAIRPEPLERQEQPVQEQRPTGTLAGLRPSDLNSAPATDY